MGKGNGSTRSSSSSSPRGLNNVSTGAISARMSNSISDEERHALNRKLGDGFALPVYERAAREYQEATGRELPKDAVRIVFGRGAANGKDYYETLKTPKYSNLKTEDITIGKGYSAEDVTYLTGYSSFEQLREFVKDVREASWRTRYERLQRRWSGR